MMNFDYETIYVSSAINTLSNCSSWNNKLVCAMNKSITFVDQTQSKSKIFKQYTFHTSLVTCVKWINDHILVSGDSDGNLILWIIDDDYNLLDKKSYNTNIKASIVDISAVELQDKIIIFGVVCDNQMKIFNFEQEITETNSVNFGNSLVLSIDLCLFSESFLFISCGLDSGYVQCRVLNPCKKELPFTKPVSLSGHSDWVTCLTSTRCSDGDVLLATGSQDSFIRVWRVTVKRESVSHGDEDNLAVDKLDVEKLSLPGSGMDVCVYLDGVLTGHEGWLTSLQFVTDSNNSLVSWSADRSRSVIIWRRCEDSDGETWSETMRLGPGPSGTNGMGFCGGCVNQDGSLILGYGYQGDVTVYASTENGLDSLDWTVSVSFGGHYNVVEDLCWEAVHGRYLLTVSKDQTTRLHIRWTAGDNEWHEFGRPQVHGYDMTCISSLDPVTFVSGGDEKVARVFGMNRKFADYLSNETQWSTDEPGRLSEVEVRPDALGLSGANFGGGFETPAAPSMPTTGPCHQDTLWPETAKLYGHGFELYRVSSRRDGGVATSSKAIQLGHTDIALWRKTPTGDWSIQQRLEHHRNLVTRTVWSHDETKLLSVSRDHQWVVWRPDVETGLLQLAASGFAHNKVITDAVWTHDDQVLITSSRDKQLMATRLPKDEETATTGLASSALKLPSAVYAVALVPTPRPGDTVLAVGLDSGEVLLVSLDTATLTWTQNRSLGLVHSDQVTRLAFQPGCRDQPSEFLLASASRDRFVKIIRLRITAQKPQ